MKKNISILILMLLISNLIFSQNENRLYPKVNKVTIFKSSAQIEKSIPVFLNKGFNEIILCGNSPELNKQSVQFNSSSDYLITEFTPYIQTVREDKAAEEKLDNKSKEILTHLKDSLVIINKAIYDIDNLKKVYYKQLEVLEDIQSVSESDTLLGVRKMKETLHFYRNKAIDVKAGIAKCEKESLKYNRRRDELKSNIQLILQGDEEKQNANKNEYYIKLVVHAEKDIQTLFEYKYSVSSVNWNPFYDVKLAKSNEYANLILKTEFQQNTGEDWKDVKLVFSTHDSQEQSEPYELEPMVYSLKYENSIKYKGDNIIGKVIDISTSEPLPYTIIILEQNGVQKAVASTDMNGNYKITGLKTGYYDIIASMVGYNKAIRRGVKTIPGNTKYDIKLEPINIDMEEIDIKDYSLPTLESEEDIEDYQGVFEEVTEFEVVEDNVPLTNEFSVESFDKKENIGNYSPSLGKEYEVKMNYTINSGEREKIIPLEEKKAYFFYKYYSVPKTEKMMYSSALFPSWVDLELINAKAKIYIDENFVNDSYISNNQTTDTLALPIGKEKKLAIDRKVVFSQPKKLNRKGTMLESEVTISILAKNNKDESVNMRIDDQIPISNIENITIENKELSSGILDPKTGILYWDINLKALESKTLTISYIVRYPSNAKIAFD